MLTPRPRVLAVLSLSAGLAVACTPAAPAEGPAPSPPEASPEDVFGTIPDGASVYLADLIPVNRLEDLPVTLGRAAFLTWGDSVRIVVDVAGSVPGRKLVPEIHGIEGLAHASCPLSVADVNGDGLIRAEEARPYSGRPLLALTTAEAEAPSGWLHYDKRVALPELEELLRNAHEGERSLDLERRAIYLQLLPAPAEATGEGEEPEPIPVACGRIRVANR